VSDSLLELGERTLAAAVAAANAALGEGAATAVADSVELPNDPFTNVELPAVVADVPFNDGDLGTFVLVLTHAGALRAAAAQGAIDEEAAEFGGAALNDAALDAVGQLTHRIAKEAADERVAEALPRRTPARIAETDSELRRGVGAGTATVRARLTILGEAAIVIQAMPSAAVRGLDDRGEVEQTVGSMPLGAALHDIDVRVWAELGRTRMPTGQVVGLPSGAIVELDREAEDAVDLYVDGQLYATGRLVVTEDDNWGVRVERVLGLA
jgi:flagellar motor switch protein FliN/FliY